VVSPLLIGIMVAIYWFVAGDSASRDTLAMQTDKVFHGQVWRLVTASFLHLRLQHLVGNVIPLCILSSLGEKLFGPSRLLFLWLATGTAGSITELLGFRRPVFSYGASTVEYGLLGVLLTVYLFKRRPVSKIGAALVALLVTYTTAGFLVDWFIFHRVILGHIGGLVSGLLLAWIVPLKAVPQARELDHAAPSVLC
jgi:membrane associated rhomboid family serine protease